MIGGQPYASLRHPLSHVGSPLDAAALHSSRSARNHLLWLAHSRRSAAAVKLPRHQLPLALQRIGAVMVAIVRESPDLEQGS